MKPLPENKPTVSADPAKWVDLIGDSLYRMALSVVRDPAIAEELVQETFLGALRSLKSFQKRSSERTWLIAILKYKIVDHFRAKYKIQHMEFKDEISLEKPDSQFDSRGEWAAKPRKWHADPTKLYEQKEFLEILSRCLSKLSPRMAKAFMMREIDGLDTEELFKELEISVTNSWVILHRARIALRGCLERNWFRSDASVP